MTARLAENRTVAAESGIADPVGSLFQSSYGRGERLIHRRRSLHGRDVFGAPGEVLGFETGRRRRQSRQSDRPGARAGRVELIGATVPGSSPTMVARRTGESAMVFSVRVSGEGSRRGDPGILMSPQGELEGGAASGQGCRHLAGPGRADPGGRRLGRLPDRLVSGRVPLASREPESGRSPPEPVVVRARFERDRVRRGDPGSPRARRPASVGSGLIFDRDELFDAS